MMIKRIILFLMVGFIYSCALEGDPVGHWHIVNDEYPDERYWAVDILNDSTVIEGINSINRQFAEKPDSHDKEMIYLWECGSGVFKYKVKGDKIYLWDEDNLNGSFSGFKCDDDCCDKAEELLMDLKVDVALPEIHQQREVIKTVQLPKHLSCRIILGKPKEIYQKNYGSDLQMQLNDKFSSLEVIPFFIEEKQQDIPEKERKNINIEIIADQNITLKRIQAIIKELKKLKIKNIWIAYFRETRRLIPY